MVKSLGLMMIQRCLNELSFIKREMFLVRHIIAPLFGLSGWFLPGVFIIVLNLPGVNGLGIILRLNSIQLFGAEFSFFIDKSEHPRQRADMSMI